MGDTENAGCDDEVFCCWFWFYFFLRVVFCNANLGWTSHSNGRTKEKESGKLRAVIYTTAKAFMETPSQAHSSTEVF